MTQGGAQQALEESTVESQASSLTTTSVEISTNFTIGKAVGEAAADLRTFIGTQFKFNVNAIGSVNGKS